MVQIIGLLAVLILVFSALLSTGTGILAALPFELFLIGGAALATLLLGNSPKTAVEALGGFVVAVRSAKWRATDYRDVLTLCYTLSREARRGGLVAIERDIEDPSNSPRFKKYPRLLKDSTLVATICDGYRMLGLDLSDPSRADEVMHKSIEAHRDQRHRAANALHTLADALPALGIVAAVIGIIRAMSVIDQAPNVIGAMMASALLGTFLGVFLAYGVVGPIANRFSDIIDDELKINDVAATFISAHGQGVPPRAAAELARAIIPAEFQPAAHELSHAIHNERFSGKRDERTAA